MRERKTPSKFIIATGVFLLAACSDGGPMAPARPTMPAKGAGAIVSAVTAGDTSITVLSVNAWAKQTASFDMGTFKLVIPANAICSLATSSYGPTEWDQPCVPEAGTVTITVRTWTDASGHARTDFQPHMRFNPAAEPVILTLKDKAGVQPGAVIVYCADLASSCVDESLTDPSLVTSRDPNNGNFYRRVKHFSGYAVASGFSTDSTVAE